MATTETGAASAVVHTGATDARLIIAARGLRSFGYGLLAVLLGVALSAAGLTPVAMAPSSRCRSSATSAARTSSVSTPTAGAAGARSSSWRY